MDTLTVHHRPTLQSHQTPFHIASVTLAVRDLDVVSQFYQQTMGLALLSAGSNAHDLGVDRYVLLRLVRMPSAAPRERGAAGLFHTAFLVPSRTALGDWLRAAIASGVRIDGASDHGVSEAIYLNDPEGNGIEIYADRPRSAWRVTEGQVQMGSARLDIEALLAAATPHDHGPFALAAGSRIGHIHLEVPSLEMANSFFQGIWGMEKMFALPGAHFYANGGYHHHIAANIWNTRKGAMPSSDSLGLQHVMIGTHDDAARRALEERWHGSNTSSSAHSDAIVAPWGLAFSLIQ